MSESTMNSGIVDARYVNESGDRTYKEGQRIAVTTEDIEDLVAFISKLAIGIRKGSGM